MAARASLSRRTVTRLVAVSMAILGGVAMAGLSACTPVGVIVGAGATAGVAIAEERSLSNTATDTRITVEIAEALFQTHIDDLFRPITTDVVEGRVMLTGMVKTQQLADQAAEIAWKVDSVNQVYNDLQIGDDSLVDPVRDRWITTKLRSRVLADAGIFDVNYAITTVAGAIHLIGIAQDQAEIDRVMSHASDVAHVRRVVSHVVLKTDPSRPQADEG